MPELAEKLVNTSIEHMPPRTTIMAIFETYDEAASSVRAIESSGVCPDAIRLIDHDMRDAPLSRVEGAGLGAVVGAALGGGAGLLAALGVLSIPGLGPVVATGWIAATSVGAVAGSVLGSAVGALTSSGPQGEHLDVFAGGLRQGGAIVTVRAGSDEACDAARILKDHHALDVRSRDDDVPVSGWANHPTEQKPPDLICRKSPQTSQ